MPWQNRNTASFLAGCFAPGSGIVGAFGGDGLFFVCSTATITKRDILTLGEEADFGPFANLISSNNITIDHETNIQENVVVAASQSFVQLGKMAIPDRGASVNNGTRE